MKEFIEELGMFVVRMLLSIIVMVLYWPLNLILTLLTLIPQIIFIKTFVKHLNDKKYDHVIDNECTTRDNLELVASESDNLSDTIGAGLCYGYYLAAEKEDLSKNDLKYPLFMDIRNRFNVYTNLLKLIWGLEVVDL